jgi:exodeoxyribonuclease VII large subunit
MHLLVRARVSLYPNRGEYQLILEHMEERGEGKLRRDFEILKKKLEALGLFDTHHKKMLPAFSKRIGVITSATGAAIRDILHVLNRRSPHIPIIIYPTLVQGATAVPAIVNAIQTANHRNECDLLILARGGGSLEDLWPFNEETVAQAIYQSHIPIISGIGHEIDFTIADFVADQRAPTPSAAAELASIDRSELLSKLTRYHQQYLRQIHNQLSTTQQHLTWVQKHLSQQHPKRRLHEKMQKLDLYELTLSQLQNQMIQRLQNKIKEMKAELYSHSPIHQIKQLQNQIQIDLPQLLHLMTSIQTQKKNRLMHAAAKLDTLSPLATLGRGYAIATTDDKQVIHSAETVHIGDQVQIQLAKGRIDCQVEAIHLRSSI